MAKAEKKEEAVKAAEPQEAVESDQGPEIELTAQTKSDMERALAAAKSRLEAPQVGVTAREHPIKDFIAAFAPDTVGRDADWHAYTDSPKNHHLNLSKGYIPVIDPTTGRPAVAPEGDWLYKLPMALYKQDLAKVKARSDAILSKTKKGRRSVRAGDDGDGDVIAHVEEEITVQEAELVP